MTARRPASVVTETVRNPDSTTPTAHGSVPSATTTRRAGTRAIRAPGTRRSVVDAILAAPCSRGREAPRTTHVAVSLPLGETRV